jgi:SagB-type dehydrogenase family enzyme
VTARAARKRAALPRRPPVDKAVTEACRRIPEGAAGKGWQPLAAAFHFGTRDIRWRRGAALDMFEAAQTHRAVTDPPPPPFKAVVGAGTPLPAGPYRGEFARVLLARRTWRGFGSAPLIREQLGPLLDLTFGAQMAGAPRSGGEVIFKTSPSGGARHPIEAYVLVLRVTGVTPGFYHYAPKTGRLHLVRKGASSAQAVDFLAGQTWFEGAAAIVFMSALLPRLWWRYDHARVYRAALLEAGHVCQTFCLTATWLGLAPFCTMALEDSRIERALKIDGVTEVLLYAAGVGSRPADGRWVQWPGNTPDISATAPPKKSRKLRARSVR